MTTPINPYEPSAHVSEPVGLSSQSEPTSGPRYTSRLDWRDRQALLKSLGPIRLTVVIGGLYWLKNVVYYAGAAANLVTRSEPIDGPGIAFAMLATSWLFQGVLSLYSYRLYWNYADSLQAAAGGRTASHHDWTQLHYRTWWLSALCWILAAATDAGNWLVQRWAMAGFQSA